MSKRQFTSWSAMVTWAVYFVPTNPLGSFMGLSLVWALFSEALCLLAVGRVSSLAASICPSTEAASGLTDPHPMKQVELPTEVACHSVASSWLRQGKGLAHFHMMA